jgi:hypothetical protein
MSDRLCAGTTAHGKLCRSLARRDSAFCIRHDPALTDEQRARLMYPMSPRLWPSCWERDLLDKSLRALERRS